MPKIVEHKGKKYWINGEGEKIPANRIFPHEKRADRVVTRVMKRVQKLHQHTIKEKEFIVSEIKKYLEILAKENNTTKVEGNANIYDFAKDNKIEQKLNKVYITDERIAIAKQKIDKLILKWSVGVNDNILVIINRAFKTNKNGEMNVKELLTLKDAPIKDKEWKEAVQLIIDSIGVGQTKLYWVFKTRDEDGEFKSIPLNFSAL